ncbi:MAG TPA: MOSC N-terminal beta barrel domain-containing protein [Gaiellaceae bacterium]|nr:MOSC N-terminal beta barrel domain-containing protein [Gaiellaceae bacterium]
MASVTRINVAPVKALGLVHPDAVELGLRGVVGNRRFWLVDAERRLYNNKRDGPLVRIRPEWDEGTRELALTFPDGTRVAGTVDLGDPFEVQMYGYPLASRRVVGPWQEAISDYAGTVLTLLWADECAPDRLYAGTTTIVSHASLDRLAAEAGGDGLDGRRFRMLFEIDGVGAHEEDEWLGRDVRVGAAVVRVHGDVGRCAVTTHDPDTGVPTVDTLRALARYRREGRSEPLPFGVYGSVVEPGPVRLGDAVTAVS